MTRITYQMLPDGREVSNLMLTSDGRMIFVEIVDGKHRHFIIKDVEGEPIASNNGESIEDLKRKARELCITLGVFINQEVREKNEL